MTRDPIDVSTFLGPKAGWRWAKSGPGRRVDDVQPRLLFSNRARSKRRVVAKMLNTTSGCYYKTTHFRQPGDNEPVCLLCRGPDLVTKIQDLVKSEFLIKST